MARMVLLLLALLAMPTAAEKSTAEAQANPIRKVVTMLQKMQETVEAEGKKEEELFDKYMCYCKNADSTLGKSIQEAQTKIPDLESATEELGGKKSQLESDIKDHKSDQEAAKTAMGDSTALREKDSKAFAAESAEQKACIEALGKAIAAIDKGSSAAFLQTDAADTLKKAVEDIKDMDEYDQQTLMSFLSGTQSDSDEESSGSEVLGVMKQLKEQMQKELDEATKDEENSITDYNELMASKKKEIAALQKMVEEKMQRVGELAVEIQETQNELGDLKDALKEDSKMYADLKQNCGKKQKEYEARQKIRAEELLALADTIKLLNSDDALELFKKTLPGATFLVQIQVSASSMKKSALQVLKKMRHKSKHKPQLDFIVLALHQKKVGFEKVLKMVDDMITNMKAEQAADDEEKAYCEKELDLADDKKKEYERAIKDIGTSISKGKDGLAAAEAEIDAVSDGIRKLDKQVAEATEQRKEENEEFKSLVAGNAAAKQLLGMAKTRLNKFYNPKAAAALAQASSDSETSSDSSTYQHQKSGGIIAMIMQLMKELDIETAEAEAEEKNAQADYEQFMEDSKVKRSEDSKMLTEKEASKADLETKIGEDHAAKKSASKDLLSVNQYILSLHAKCDFILQYYDERKKARASEIDSLGKAKDVLSGADLD
eukprot:gnl/TRDRNA2_/TRDRNA2_175443_c5_seq1.p1 gnl/TRDRNA2_/TRDRNA2_175443_c5~~gnl/TRDRNA2_/TRDRNA2_175443_c5_seq1.p1  ORF type:complete len:662 (+),score=278.79 gnl/TRDRNA2_/TRDRNA2_175443_c5_seq1:71-2056(+)